MLALSPSHISSLLIPHVSNYLTLHRHFNFINGNSNPFRNAPFPVAVTWVQQRCACNGEEEYKVAIVVVMVT